jgi:flagellar basal body-associated protein FliL
MKPLSILNIVLACVTLLLTLLLISNNKQNRALQSEAQSLILQIQKNQKTLQVTGNVATRIIKDMAQLSVQNQNLNQLLQKHGFNVQVRK